MRGDHGVRPRMLLRGRLTIAAGLGLVFFVAWALFAGDNGASATESGPHPAVGDVAAFPEPDSHPRDLPGDEADPVEPDLPVPLPAESAPAPKAAPAGDGRSVPPAILGRVPIPLPGSGAARVPRLIASGASAQVTRGRRVVEVVPTRGDEGVTSLRVEYTLDAGLTDAIYDIFARGRVPLGLAVVMDPATGEVLAYAGTDPRRLPPDQLYPAASLVKVVTAAAALQSVPGAAYRTCRFVGSPYRLTPSRVTPPRRGTEITLERALATSNNQCFAQLAVNDLGQTRLLETFRRFGLLQSPGPSHPPGEADTPGDDRFALGKLGCGLAGLHITALHAAELAATLADGKRVAPRWIARVTDDSGRELALPPQPKPAFVVPSATAAQLREMMVETTLSGTARRAFRGRVGRPLLREMTVAAKTGSLSGKTPPGRYEWFIGLAPASRPKIAIAVLVVQPKRWHTTASQVGAQVLNAIFCAGNVCRVERADQWLAARASSAKRALD